MRLSYFCKCGASMTANVSSASAANKIQYVWTVNHSGEGHGQCDKKECHQARRKAENAAIKEGTK